MQTNKIQELEGKILKLKGQLNANHKTMSTMKVYANNVPLNEVIAKIKEKLNKGIRASAIAVYCAMEAHVNTNCEVNVSQERISSEIGLSREYVNFLIGKLAEAGIIRKIRRGLKQVNQYILEVKKAMMSIVNELTELYIEMARQKKSTYINKNKNKTGYTGTWTGYNEEDKDINLLEKKLLGRIDIDEILLE